MKKVWRKVRLLDPDGFENRNAVAMAGAVEGLKRPGLRISRPADANPRKELSQLSFRPLR